MSERVADGGITDRRQFTVGMAMALLGGAAITIGCGGGGGGGGNPAAASGPVPSSRPTPPPPPANIRFGDVSNNHGHEAVITNAVLLAGEGLRLNILGGATHQHDVELYADEVVRIRNGERIEKESTENSGLFGPHFHVVGFN